jgi:hypothetical protein
MNLHLYYAKYLLLYLFVILTSQSSLAYDIDQLQNEQEVYFVPIAYDGYVIPIYAGSGIPPEPGSSGNITIPGTDTDRDGIRDDVERKIGLMYPNHPVVRAYSYVIAMNLQDAINNPTSLQQQELSLNEILEADRCLIEMNLQNLYVGSQEIIPMVLNTYQRSYAYLDAMKMFQGKVLQSARACPN